MELKRLHEIDNFETKMVRLPDDIFPNHCFRMDVYGSWVDQFGIDSNEIIGIYFDEPVWQEATQIPETHFQAIHEIPDYKKIKLCEFHWHPDEYIFYDEDNLCWVDEEGDVVDEYVGQSFHLKIWTPWKDLVVQEQKANVFQKGVAWLIQ